MTSVERILDYCQLEEEEEEKMSFPPIRWPFNGEIVFDDVSLSYSNVQPFTMALDHISLKINGGEKIGIVGRTGAGKSSLIQTLFRMSKLTTGRIFIDQIDISTIRLDEVRRRISIIPQDPILFSGTIRNNLDRFGDYSDAEIWNALEKVEFCFSLIFLIEKRERNSFRFN